MVFRRYVICAIVGMLLRAALAVSEEIILQSDGRYATRDIQEKMTFLPGGKVIVNSASGLSGRLYIFADTISEVSFDYKKVFKTSQQDEAAGYDKVIDVTLEKTPEGMRLLLQAPNPAPWEGSDNSGQIEGDLRLPYNCQLEFDAPYFDLIISGPFEKVENKSSFGRLEVQKVYGKVRLSTSNQDILAREISGDITLITSNADIRIDSLATLEEPARIRNENGNVLISGAHGGIDIESSYGKIKADDLYLTGDGSRISGSYGPIRLTLAGIEKSSLVVENTNGIVEIRLPDDISSNFKLSVNANSEIDVYGLDMKPALIGYNQMEFRCGQGESQINVGVESNGNILIRGIPARTDENK
jgi:hypothetical protein